MLGWIAAGTLQLEIACTFPLAEAAAARRLVESRTVAGKIILVP